METEDFYIDKLPSITDTPELADSLDSNLTVENTSYIYPVVYDEKQATNNSNLRDKDYEPEIQKDSDSDSDLSESDEIRHEINHNGLLQNEPTLETDHGNMLEGRKRSIKRQEENWEKNKTKRLRMEGKTYMDYSRKYGKVSRQTPREARKLGPACNSKECKRTKAKFTNYRTTTLKSFLRCFGMK